MAQPEPVQVRVELPQTVGPRIGLAAAPYLEFHGFPLPGRLLFSSGTASAQPGRSGDTDAELSVHGPHRR